MQKITKHIIKAIEKGMKIEKARHPDWDDNKHRMKVLVNLDADNEKVIIDFTKENQ
jgi:N-methylhydantoinase B/oxoprolinase/acetone carboxylase alpha subunit